MSNNNNKQQAIGVCQLHIPRLPASASVFQLVISEVTHSTYEVPSV